jgi:hypothetical protein
LPSLGAIFGPRVWSLYGALWLQPAARVTLWGAQTRSRRRSAGFAGGSSLRTPRDHVKLMLAGVAIQVTGLTATDLISLCTSQAKRLAKAKRDRRQRDAAHPATDWELHPSAGVHRPHPRAARVRARPSASRSHRSVGPHTFANTGRLVVESACSQRKDHVPTWLWIVIIVIVALAVLGYFGRGRFSR